MPQADPEKQAPDETPAPPPEPDLGEQKPPDPKPPVTKPDPNIPFHNPPGG